MSDTFVESAQIAERNPTAPGAHDAASAIPYTLCEPSSPGSNGERKADSCQPSRLIGAAGGERYLLTQRGWEASMSLPALTRQP